MPDDLQTAAHGQQQSKSYSRELAELALDVRYEQLPDYAVHHAKTILIDTLACLVGGYKSETGRICREVADELGGAPEASLIGSGRKASVISAILTNSASLRYLDYNDSMDLYKGPNDDVGAHPSDALPVAFAICEQKGLSGKRFLEGMFAGYQVMGRLIDCFANALEPRGFHHGSINSFVGAAMAGNLLELNADQLTNAMGIGGSLTLALNILDSDGEEYVMTKNIADGFHAKRGYVAALFARRGFTGPERVIEGNKGFATVVLGGVDRYVDLPIREEPYIMMSALKGVPAEATTHGFLTAITLLAQEQPFNPDDIEEIRIRTMERTLIHCGDPVKKYPRNKETADHSAYFLAAITAMEGRISAAAYAGEKYRDPKVLELIDKVVLEHGPEFDKTAPAASASIRLEDGRVLTRTAERHEIKGLPENPMTEDDARAKFYECAEGLMSAEQIEKVIAACRRVEEYDRFEDVLSLIKLE